MPKYDEFGRPTDGSRKNFVLVRPHGRGTFAYATLEEAEQNAPRLAKMHREPIRLLVAIAEYEVDEPPVVRRPLARGFDGG